MMKRDWDTESNFTEAMFCRIFAFNLVKSVPPGGYDPQIAIVDTLRPRRNGRHFADDILDALNPAWKWDFTDSIIEI